MKTSIWNEYEDLEDPQPVRRKSAARPKSAQPSEDEPTGEQADSANDPTVLLASFFAEELIVDTPTVVKSGKEATVYCCRAHPRLQCDWLAAKVYRPRRHRGFKNDAVYMQGRTTFDQRLDRAIRNKSDKGREIQFSMWISSEFGTLSRLHAAGADVPQPFGTAPSALLIEYFGERGMAAPQLISVELSPKEARPLFDQLVHNLEILLECDRVHGDLSPYNILYWEGRLQIIDFPQAVDPMDNPQAYKLFVRDVTNVCDYFAAYGIQTDPHRLSLSLWLRSGRAHP